MCGGQSSTSFRCPKANKKGDLFEKKNTFQDVSSLMKGSTLHNKRETGMLCLFNKKISLLWMAIALWLTVCTFKSHAQEYRYETGAALGISCYMGDANKRKPFLHPGITGGALFRYNVNFHWALKANLLSGGISGNTEESGDAFPFERDARFQRTFIASSVAAEFHFLPYSDKYGYRGTKPFTPYLFAGVGATYATGEKYFLGVHFPYGVGCKYKWRNRVNIGLEFSLNKLLGDDLDVTEKGAQWSLDAPYGIESSLWKNRDRYAVTTIFVTWDFGMREDPCRGN